MSGVPRATLCKTDACPRREPYSLLAQHRRLTQASSASGAAKASARERIQLVNLTDVSDGLTRNMCYCEINKQNTKSSSLSQRRCDNDS